MMCDEIHIATIEQPVLYFIWYGLDTLLRKLARSGSYSLVLWLLVNSRYICVCLAPKPSHLCHRRKTHLRVWLFAPADEAMLPLAHQIPVTQRSRQNNNHASQTAARPGRARAVEFACGDVAQATDSGKMQNLFYKMGVQCLSKKPFHDVCGLRCAHGLCIAFVETR